MKPGTPQKRLAPFKTSVGAPAGQASKARTPGLWMFLNSGEARYSALPRAILYHHCMYFRRHVCTNTEDQGDIVGTCRLSQALCLLRQHLSAAKQSPYYPLRSCCASECSLAILCRCRGGSSKTRELCGWDRGAFSGPEITCPRDRGPAAHAGAQIPERELHASLAAAS